MSGSFRLAKNRSFLPVQVYSCYCSHCLPPDLNAGLGEEVEQSSRGYVSSMSSCGAWVTPLCNSIVSYFIWAIRQPERTGNSYSSTKHALVTDFAPGRHNTCYSPKTAEFHMPTLTIKRSARSK